MLQSLHLQMRVGPGDAEGVCAPVSLWRSYWKPRVPARAAPRPATAAQLACLKPPCPSQPASWASTSRPPGTSSAPAALRTATLQPPPPRPAAATSATTARPWTHHPQPAPVSSAPSPRIPQPEMGQDLALPGLHGPSQCSAGEAGTGGSLGPGATRGWRG